MITVAPSSSKPFWPDVCAYCGCVLTDAASASETPTRNGALPPAATGGAQVCAYCGNALPDDSTDPLENGALLQFMAEAIPELPASPTMPFSLIAVTTGRTINLPSISTIHLGRRDAKRNVFPHVDLTHDRAIEHGVSRRHAHIHQNENGVYIEDLSSTNGTFVNHQRLIPFTLFPLNHGDVIELGQLRLIVSLPRQAGR